MTENSSVPLRLLVVTNMYPSFDRPSFGTFVKRQVDTLSAAGCHQDLIIIESWRSRMEYLRAINRIRKAVRKGDYDLVHAYYGLCGFVAAFQSRVPLAVTYCGSDLNPGFAGHHKAPLKSRIIVVLGQIAALRAAACFVQSREMLGRILFPRARERAHIVTCGVDLELFQPGDPRNARSRLGWKPDERVILFVCSEANLPAVKRPELAKAVASRVKRVFPETRLEIASGKPQHELPDYYQAADLLLLTSASEGSPNVVKEALACNLPVVSTPVGDVPDLLRGLKNCHVCDADPEAMAQRVVEVLITGERTDSRQRMHRFSMERTSVTVLNIYKSICSGHAPTTRSLSQEECSRR